MMIGQKLLRVSPTHLPHSALRGESCNDHQPETKLRHIGYYVTLPEPSESVNRKPGALETLPTAYLFFSTATASRISSK